MLLGGLATGAQATVGSTYNIAAPLYQRIMDAFSEGELERARNLQTESCQLIADLIERVNFVGALKYLLSNIADIPIGASTRAPLPRLETEQLRTLDPWIEKLASHTLPVRV
jgi:N-acetylneuraminate lyase